MAKSSTSFKEGNQAHLTHGASSYEDRTALDKPIPIRLAEVERSVLADLRANGPRGIVEAELVRNATIARLMWAAMSESQEKFLSMVKYYFYASNNAQRAAQALANLPEEHAPTAGEILASYEVRNDEQDTDG
jgi:hypothetical protein